ncbi:MAG: hypothetical protein H0U89_10705, partial [Acidimicrobiia bacterium]|nr:hypothetical protein [Acidimicrobiia bacterium]
MSKGRWIRRSRKGAIELRLTDPERQLLVSLASALRTSLDGGDVRGNPALTRLFPPAYADAEEGEAEADYQSLVHADLLASRRAHLAVLEATAVEERLDEEQLLA